MNEFMNEPDRDRYNVILTVHTEPRMVTFTKYANSPEHAIKKAKQELGSGYVVLDAIATRIEDGNK